MISLDEALERCWRVTRRTSGRGPRPRVDWEQVIRLWFDCRNQHAVARRLNLRPSRVGTILRRCGIRVGRGKRDPVHPLPMETVARRYRAGESCRQIAETLGVDEEV